jgi:antitoxin (DNA-binding transcriptional repressor) of toxin-antitoxin stability system
MAVIHISEAEAAHELPRLIDKVRAGEQVCIDRGTESFALVPAAEGFPVGWTTDDAVRRSEARNTPVTLDDDFASDMEEIMRFNRQGGWPNDWESS